MATTTITRPFKDRIIKLSNRFEDCAIRNSVTSGDVLRVISQALDKCERALSLIGENPIARNDERPKTQDYEDDRAAFRQFMSELQDALDRAGDRVRVTSNVSFVKIEGRNGHRVYVSKGKLSVGRIDSTLPPEEVPGARAPLRRNGRIASWLPASPEAVSQAIDIIASERTRPLR